MRCTTLRSLVLATVAVTAFFAACKADEKFPKLTDEVVSPVDVAVSDDGSHFYVLNADFDRTYNTGSLLALDADGNKVGHVKVPRMGRNLVLAGNDLLVTYDYRDDDENPRAELYDVSTPESPTLKAAFELECSPANAVMRKGYDHFALTCIDGRLYIGTLAADRAASTIKLVRSYRMSRRALVLDPTRELLFAFPSDPEQTKLADSEYADITQYDADATEVLVDDKQTPNEVPDDMEKNKRQASNKSQRRQYQFVVYDIAAERANAPDCTVTAEETCAFPYREDPDSVVDQEHRWIYFKLSNFDGTPDNSTYAQDPNYKYYRSNFWEGQPDPADANVFYLSHRGPPSKSVMYANQIVRVTLIDDPHVGEDGKIPATERYMTFDRVYGFKGQGVGSDGVDNFKYHFPGDFEIAEVDGQKLLVVNHFRDLGSNKWKRGDTYFSLGAQVIDDFTWFTEQTGSATAGDVTTYYRVAMNGSGKAVSCSFYGNAVMLLQVTPGVGMEVLKRIQ